MDNTRVMLEVGHNKFICPPEVKADSLRCLLNAVHINSVYIGGARGSILVPEADTQIGITIIKMLEVEFYLDSRSVENKDTQVVKHQEYDIILEPLKEAIAGKEHAPIQINDYHVRIGKQTFDYKNLSDQTTDPEEIIKEMVEAALDKKNMVKI